MSVSDPCVSLATGTLNPDLRVNYTRGMVLGVGEFLQEQLYFLDKDYLHERALHGYGTVYGLEVSTSPAGSDYQVQVSPGMGIDQWGREIVIRTPQCANLGAWLAAQEQQHPGTIAANLSTSGVSGELTVYLVVSYDTCLDDLVPLPGQPCSSSAQTQVASRTRDAWNLDLRWAPPDMPAWDADRRLARLLDAVQIVPGLDSSQSDEQAITGDVLALATFPAGSPSDIWPPELSWPAPSNDPSRMPLRLPAETAADALDRIFTVWVTQVRPQLTPGLTDPDPSSDSAILLATVTFLPASPFSVTNPALISPPVPDDSGRPYLLHTSLLQELRGTGTAVAPAPSTARQLVTLSPEVDASGMLTAVTAAFRLDQPVQLTEPIEITSTSGMQGAFAATADPSGFSSLWTLTPLANFAVADGDQLTAVFGGATVLVGDAATTLAAELAGGLSLLDATSAGDVLAYATVQITPPPPPSPAAGAEFVTITPEPVLNIGDPITVELWFHPEPSGPRDSALVNQLALRVFDENSGAPVAVSNQQQDQTYRNVWQLTFGTLGPGPHPPAVYLRLIFGIQETVLATPGGDMSLAAWIEQQQIQFVGWSQNQDEIVAFTRVPLPGLGG